MVLLILWSSQSGRSLKRHLWELQIVSINFIHEFTLVLYKQLLQNGFGCYSSKFTLSRAFYSTRIQSLGEPSHTSYIALQYRLGLAPMHVTSGREGTFRFFQNLLPFGSERVFKIWRMNQSVSHCRNTKLFLGQLWLHRVCQIQTTLRSFMSKANCSCSICLVYQPLGRARLTCQCRLI